MTRALVLGGGGPVGIAWETGLLHGLASEGIDLSRADAIIGSSAGSVVGAQLASGLSPADIYGRAIDRKESAPPTATRGPVDMQPLMAAFAKMYTSELPETGRWVEMGAFALAAETISEDEFVAGFQGLLASAGGGAWPGHGYTCTAIEAERGEFVTWDASSNVPLARAVASSCSVPGIFPPITINGHRYFDGGIRTATNADLAKGHERVLIVSVTGRAIASAEASTHPIAQRMRAGSEAELDAIRDGGGDAAVIMPDDAFVNAFGVNLMDFTRSREAVEIGAKQGLAEAARIKELWT